jgi:hypothetical protein
VILGALSGLLCFLFADVYEATSMLDWLPITVPSWALQALYAVQVLFPLAVVYAIMRHRVINVRLVLNRSVVVLGSLVLATIALAGFDLAFHEEVRRNAPWIAGVAALVAGVLHERLREITDVVDWLFFHRWFVAERELKRAAERLSRAQVDHVADVDRALIDLPADRLTLTSAALFLREPDGGFRRLHATPSWPDRFMQTMPPDHPLAATLKDAPLRLPDAYFSGPVYMPRPFRMPVLAVPLETRGVLRRIALYGPHTNDETLDRDEVNVIARLAQGAAYAYAELEAAALRIENERLLQQLKEAQASIAGAPRVGGAAAGGAPDAAGPRA